MMLQGHCRMVRVSSFTLMGNSSAFIREQSEFCDYRSNFICVLFWAERVGESKIK